MAFSLCYFISPVEILSIYINSLIQPTEIIAISEWFELKWYMVCYISFTCLFVKINGRINIYKRFE